MAPGAGAQLPHARIRFVVQRVGALARPFQPLEVVRLRLAQQPRIEECLRGREHDIAVDVELIVLVGGVARAHRLVTAITGEIVDGALGQLGLHADAVHRLQPTVPGSVVFEVGEITQVVLHRRHF